MTGVGASEQCADSASESDRALAGALIGGAFGFIGLAIFSSASYAEKVDPTSLWWGNIAAMIAVFFLVASIIFGGLGWTRQSRSGFSNQFNLQALFGLVGIVLLSFSAGIFAFNPKPSGPSDEMEVVMKQMGTLQAQLALERRIVDYALGNRYCSTIAPVR
ncbi:hypothetical protein FVA81_07985 [Rhizobium sp. WL3]|uniref:hypothetical protein n=1 Tax=Rhizobium sp. WL3 TaxID=2603277 RepID=UPI0011C1E652|nr:hypothetical protein [Rhizobium sp. WL3]QEE44548.1 hypothetical protein FVA81_07985 [Rhizobium sp. WL3]